MRRIEYPAKEQTRVIGKRNRWKILGGDMGTTFMFVNRSFACVAIFAWLTLAACKQGHPPLNQESARQELIQNGVQFSTETFLESARNGDVEKVRLFLQAGINCDATDERGRTALMESASFNNVPTIQILIARGATVNLKDRDGYTALIHAAVTGSAEALSVLAEAGAVVNLADNRGSTALIYSALDARYECVKALLERGADIEAMTTDGYTALLMLVKHTK